MSYFVCEDNYNDELISFFNGLNIEWKIKPLENGYSLIRAKMGIVDKVIYRLIFMETKKNSHWSRLKTI